LADRHADLKLVAPSSLKLAAAPEPWRFFLACGIGGLGLRHGRILAWLWLWIQRFGHIASGCFLFCTRHAFEAAGGFDQTLYAAEDVVLSRRLRRLGRFVILREVVVTSGRNLRSHSAFETLRILAGFALRGPGFFRTRHGPWHGQRRDDPDHTA